MTLGRALRAAAADGRQVAALLALALAAGALWGFVELADMVIEGETRAVDERILLALRSPAQPDELLGPQWLEELGRDVTALGGWGVLTLLVLAAGGYLVLKGKPRMAVLLVCGVALGRVLGAVLKLGIARPRPDLVPHETQVYTASFPSGHAMMAAVTYLTLAALLMRVERSPAIRLYLLALAAMVTFGVGVSRVYLGVHWPTDVVAGWAIGSGWALLWWAVATVLQGRGVVEGDNSPELR